MSGATRRAGVVALVLAAGTSGADEPPAVVFVCEHGTAKSLIASRWFDRLAAERGLALRSASRGLAPEPDVPPAIARHLGEDGFDVAGFRARALAPEDLRGVRRLVLIGAAPPGFVAEADVRVDRWDDVPPASEDYAASRDALLRRIAALLDELSEP